VRNKKLKERRAIRDGQGRDDKTPVFGIVERSTADRKGQVRAWTVPSTQRETLLPILRRHVHHDATMHTDDNVSYRTLDEYFLYHQTVNHPIEYVRGSVHTNTIENFW